MDPTIKDFELDQNYVHFTYAGYDREIQGDPEIFLDYLTRFISTKGRSYHDELIDMLPSGSEMELRILERVLYAVTSIPGVDFEFKTHLHTPYGNRVTKILTALPQSYRGNPEASPYVVCSIDNYPTRIFNEYNYPVKSDSYWCSIL